MARRIAYLSVLIPAVIAIPKFSHQPQVSAGFPTGGLHGTSATAAPYGQFNSTLVGPTGTSPTSISVVTVVPVPGSANVPEGTTLTVVNTAPLVGSSDVPSQPLPNSHGGVKSPIAAFQSVDTCGPATVTVTEANTVTVTVGAVPASSFPVLPSAAHSENLGSSVQSDTETIPTRLSTGALPTVPPPVSTPKHGHNHLKFHHKSAAVISSSAPPVKPEQTEAASSAAPSVTVPNVPVAAESSSTGESSSAPHVTPKTNLAYPVPPELESSTPTAVAVSTPPVSHPVAQSSTPEPKSFGPLVPSSSSEPESKPSASLAPSSPGTKRGLVYNTAALTESFSSSSAISWCYNWDSQPGGTIPSNFNFVPMMWGPLPVHTSNWKSNADTAIAAGSTHLLGFNEPDLAEQANLTPEQAAEAWHEYMEPYAGKAKLGSPAVCNGGGTVGLNWLGRFLETCSSCTIDFIAIHWYGLASDEGVGYFKEHVGKAVEAAQGRPVWITEFKPDGSPEDQARWLGQVLPWLDDQSLSGVERYAYYQVDNILVSGDSLTELGHKYAS